MIESLKQKVLFWWNTKPLSLILTLAAILRILSAIFSKGFGMHDDHFLIIEVAQKWLEGIPHWFELGKPSLHSLIYPGLHYLLFYFLEAIGLTDPQGKMYVVRILHALYSLLIVQYGFKVALQISDKKTASIVGLMLATLWCLPFLSVRNLREITCIPPMMMGFYYLIEAEQGRKYLKNVVLSGILFGLAFTFRYQTIFFPLGIGMVLFFRKDWKTIVYFSLSYLLFVSIVQGGVDWIAWGYPFASLHAYYTYNKEHANDFITMKWYQHLITILAFLAPPASLMFIWGFIRSWKKYALIFWPVAIFLFFHSLFPNKQERFIFPLIPFLVLLGVVGWQQFVKTSEWWKEHPKLLTGLWKYFWILNTIVLVFYSFTYSKRSRVEPLYYLYKKGNVNYALLETVREKVPFPPLYYFDKWNNIYEMGNLTSIRRLKRDMRLKGNHPADYIVFYGDLDLDKRIKRLKPLYPKLKYETTINGSFIDELLLKLNPRFQANERAYIYKVVH
jgi:hypothetical protein